jgi:energy-coupling factor transport system substrate-specific component
MTDLSRTRTLSLIVVCAGLNLGLGAVVSSLKLPFFLDSVGTVLATMLGGLWIGIVTGLLTAGIGSAYAPALWAYSGTVIAIALYTALARRAGYLNRLLPTVVFGIGLGVVAALASAPVTAYVWKGATLSGTDAVTSFFLATGRTVLDSALLSGLSSDPVDKLVTSLVVYALLRRIPARWAPRPAPAPRSPAAVPPAAP